MIKNYNQFNESLLDKLQGPSEEEFWQTIRSLHPTKKLEKSIRAEYLYGINYALNHGAEVDQISFVQLKQLLKILYENNQTELLYECIESIYVTERNKINYYLFSCMYGYLKGVRDSVIDYNINRSNDPGFKGLELAIKYNHLDIVIFFITRYESTASAYDWESNAKKFADLYSNREVLDYFLYRGY